MGDMLSNSVSGLLAFQTAISTISNNIANVDTTGYSEETANLVESAGNETSAGYLGNGVSVSTITRSYNEFLAQQTNAANSSYNQYDTFSSLAASINNMLSGSTSGLSATLQSFSDAIQTMADSPSSTSTRQAVLTQAQALISQFQSYQSTYSQLGSQVNGELTSDASEITSLGQSIASINEQIMSGGGSSNGQTPNQLLDQRDELINQLSQYVNVSTVTQSDGSVNVYIGSGQALVTGSQSATLSTSPDQFDSGQLDLTLSAGSGSVDVTSSITGGEVGGLLQFQNQMLIPGENALGQAAVTLTDLVNTQNEAGLDQSGNIGTALLGVGSPAVLPSSQNTGSASVTATVSDLGGLTTSNYYLKYDGTNWSMVDTATGEATTLTASNSGGTTTLTGAGLTLTVTGTASAGDEFLVEPTANAVNGMSLLTSDPSKIAAAGPLVTSAGTANTGSASIQSATVPDTADWTRGDYTISFTSPTAYTITDADDDTVASGTYTSGTPIDFNGIDVTLTGTPATGDTFAIDDNAGGTGDNSNALQMAALMNQDVLSGGTQSLSDAVDDYVGTVGSQTSQAQNGATAQQSLLQSAQTAQSSVSGVNLDQEAANLVQFQQAYQAAAQVIQTANTLFNSLIEAFQNS